MFLVVLCVSSFLFFFRLGERPLRNPDEGRYAEIAKEMVERRDWVEPRLYGVDYLKKPPLFYWLIGASFSLFGFTEWAARIVPAIFGVLGVLITFLFACRLFGMKTAFWSSTLLASNFWYLQVGRYLVTDMVFSFFVVTALCAFYLATTEARHSRVYAVVFYACVSFSFLTKGFIGLIIPFITVFLYALSTRQLKRVFRRMRWITGFAVSALIVAPWLVQIVKREPEFLSFFIFHENLARFFLKSFEHQQPWYFYFGFFPVVFMPWIFFLKPIKHALTFSDAATRHKQLFLWIAGTALVFFFSLSKSKLATYILPATPFLSIAIARGWVEWASKGAKPDVRERVALGLFVLSGSIFAWALPIYSRYWPNDFLNSTLPNLQWLGAILAAGGLVGLGWVLKGLVGGLFYTLIFMFMAASFQVQTAMEKSNANYTTKHFAEALKPLVKPEDLVVIYGNPGPLYDFRFYLDAPVQAIALEGELQFSREDEDTSEGYILKDDIIKILAARKRVYCLTRKGELQNISSDLLRNITVIKEDKRKILFLWSASL